METVGNTENMRDTISRHTSVKPIKRQTTKVQDNLKGMVNPLSESQFDMRSRMPETNTTEESKFNENRLSRSAQDNFKHHGFGGVSSNFDGDDRDDFFD